MIFNVDDKYNDLIESVLDAISREGEVDAFAFGLTYKNGKYATNWNNCSPSELMCISGYLSMEATSRYIQLSNPNLLWEDQEEEWSREDDT